MPSYSLSSQFFYRRANRSTYRVLGNPQTFTHGSQGSFDSNTWVPNLVRIGSTNPDWRLKIAKNLDASSFYKVSGASVGTRDVTCLARMIDGSIFDSFSSTRIILGFQNLSPVDNALRDMALTRLKRKLTKHVGSFQSLVPLGEIRDLRRTITGLANATLGVVSLLTDIRKRGKRTLRLAQDAWLTYGFGIRPLLSDIDSISSSIQKFLDQSGHRVRVSSSASKDWVSSQKTSGGINRLANIQATSSFRHTLSYRWTAMFNIKTRSSNSYSNGLEHFGFTFPQILPALWELTAFSWILDYFTTAGELMEDLVWSPPGDSIYVTVNRKYTVEFEERLWFVPSPGAIIDFQREGGSKISYFEFERTPMASLPHVGFRFRTVDEIGRNATTKLLNLVSLLR